MKPDKKLCLQCGKEVSNKATFCSPKCKMAHRRSVTEDPASVTKPTVTSQNTASVTNDEFRATLTKTDKTFYDRAMRDFKKPYYIFDGELQENTCLTCGDKFKTSMPLLHYCSYEHYSNTIGGKK